MLKLDVMEEEEYISFSVDEEKYDIVVGARLLDFAGTYIKRYFGNKKLYIVTDFKVAKLYLARLVSSFTDEGFKYKVISIGAGEKNKNLDSLVHITDEIIADNPDRDAILVAFGGGIVGDLAGFAASIVFRGITLVNIPTTLIAEVDSAIGGKTGINTKHGKNLLGTYYHPSLVLTDVELIKTIDNRNFFAGYAEVAKYALINNYQFFEYLEGNQELIRSRDLNVLTQLVRVSCRSKAAIVMQDPRDESVRKFLNLGHTFAHALEVYNDYKPNLLHGEAVAIGIVLAFYTSYLLGYCNYNDYYRVKEHFKAMGLATTIAEKFDKFDLTKYSSYMMYDKKTNNGKISLILPKTIGEVFIYQIDKIELENFLRANLILE